MAGERQVGARKLTPSLVNIDEIREILSHILSDEQINIDNSADAVGINFVFLKGSCVTNCLKDYPQK